MTINRVGLVSCARIAAVIYAAIGLLMGAFLSLVAVFGMAFSSTQRTTAENPLSSGLMAAMGVGSIFVFPIFYGAVGFVLTLIAAWLYNLVASKVGGIVIDVA